MWKIKGCVIPSCGNVFDYEKISLWLKIISFFAIFLTLAKNSERWFSLSRFLWEVTNGSLWCLGTVVSPRTGASLFCCCGMAVDCFLVFSQKMCQTCLIYFSASPQAIHNLSSQQHSRSCALCPTFFAAWFHDVCCQIKSGKVRAKTEKMKWCPNEMAFTGCLVHTLRCTEMQVPKI